jgi:WD40 repeat protein
VLSCSNDTTIKIWKIGSEERAEKPLGLVSPNLNYGGIFPPEDSVARIHSFHTLDNHADYVRAMSVSESGRLFSISDDGTLQITDLNEGRLVQEFNKTSNKIPNFKG